jgi:hypothetical protein
VRVPSIERDRGGEAELKNRPPIEKNNEDLLRDFDQWLAARGGTASLEDVFASGNHLLFAGMLLKNFRKAARQAVFDTFKLEARKRGFSDADSSTAAFFFMVDQISDAWSLTSAEKIMLLGCETAPQLDALREAPFQDIPPEILERAAIVLDLFSVLNSIFSDPAVANAWVRKPNKALLFGGRPALTAMLQDGLEMLRAVRKHLWAESAGN